MLINVCSMVNNKRKNRDPVSTVIHPVAYKRLFVYLNSVLEMKDQLHFEMDLRGMLKGLYFKVGHGFYKENMNANVVTFISRGLGYKYYLHPVRGRVVADIFGANEIVLNPDSFFNGVPADTGLDFVAGTSIMYITKTDLDVLFDDHREVKMLAIKILAKMFKGIRAKDELHRLQGRAKIKHFFDLYPFLLQPARKAAMQHKDIASYLNVDLYHFSKLMKELYPDLKD